MERLTERYVATSNEKIVWVHQHDYIGASERLAEYEDTGLTPQEIMELKERDTAKAPADEDEDFDMYVCPSCDMAIGTIGDKKTHKFCLNCGQRLRWEG